MPTLEQRRAAFALAKIEGIKTSTDKAKYKTQLLKLPARLHSNGLGQTVAFYLSAGPGKPKPETIICDWLQSWLVGEQELYPPQDLVKSLAGIGLGEGVDAEARYRTASTEARALAVWLKRFAEAFIEGDKA
jgi:CRISPR type III-B/RAMP module-associated protein Cmr5